MSESLAVAAMDESNAFSVVATPEWMWPWFATPPVLAKDLWHLLDASLAEQLSSEDEVFPLLLAAARNLAPQQRLQQHGQQGVERAHHVGRTCSQACQTTSTDGDGAA